MKHPIREPRYRKIKQRAEERRREGRGIIFNSVSLLFGALVIIGSVYAYFDQAGTRQTQQRLMALEEQNLIEQRQRALSERIAEAQSLLNPGRHGEKLKTAIESRFDPRISDAIQLLADNNIKVEIAADYVELYDLPVTCAEIEIDTEFLVIGDSNIDRTRMRSRAEAVLLRDSRLNDFELIASGGLQDAIEAKVTVSNSLMIQSDIYSPVGIVRIVDSSSRDSHLLSKAGYVRFDRYRGEGTIEFSDLENLPSGCVHVVNTEHSISSKNVICRKQVVTSTLQPSWPEVEQRDCDMFADGRRSFTNLDRELLRRTARWNAIMIDEAELAARLESDDNVDPP